MSFFLVTNDDGIDSPALVPLIEALSELGTVRTVVPDRQRSWISKAITRYDELAVRVEDRGGHEIHSVSGYPADCVQLGLYSLFDGPPAMVVSGINIGYNFGSAFLAGSGTIGAAAEAAIGGFPALAVSAGGSGVWNEWVRWIETPEAAEMWHRLAAITAGLVARLAESGFPDGADLLAVNMPDSAGPDTPHRVTRLARSRYEALFRSNGHGTYVHDFRGGLHPMEELDGTDIGVATGGVVSITPVRLAHTATISAQDAAVLEHRPG